MYPVALDYGLLPEEFWKYSLREVQDLLDSRQRVREQELKERISETYELAGLIGLYVQRMFDGKVEIPSMWDTYPKLFERERTNYEAQRAAIELEDAKITRKEYAAWHNRMRRKQGGGEGHGRNDT